MSWYNAHTTYLPTTYLATASLSSPGIKANVSLSPQKQKESTPFPGTTPAVCGRDTEYRNCWLLITSTLFPTQIGRHLPLLFIPKWDYSPTVHMRHFTARRGEFLQSSQSNKKVPPSYPQGVFREMRNSNSSGGLLYLEGKGINMGLYKTCAL